MLRACYWMFFVVFSAVMLWDYLLQHSQISREIKIQKKENDHKVLKAFILYDILNALTLFTDIFGLWIFENYEASANCGIAAYVLLIGVFLHHAGKTYLEIYL